MHWFTSEQGYMEVRRWIDDLFVDPEVPKNGSKSAARISTTRFTPRVTKSRKSSASWPNSSAGRTSPKR